VSSRDPIHDLPPPYNLWNPDHIHALGAVAAIYNELEFSLYSLFVLYARLDRDIAQPLYENIQGHNGKIFWSPVLRRSKPAKKYVIT
jgi:hypothetical protein